MSCNFFKIEDESQVKHYQELNMNKQDFFRWATMVQLNFMRFFGGKKPEEISNVQTIYQFDELFKDRVLTDNQITRLYNYQPTELLIVEIIKVLVDFEDGKKLPLINYKCPVQKETYTAKEVNELAKGIASFLYRHLYTVYSPLVMPYKFGFMKINYPDQTMLLPVLI